MTGARRWLAGLAVLAVTLAPGGCIARGGQAVEARLPAAPGISVPPGYKATVFVEAGLAAPTAMAWGPDGRLYVAQLGGRIMAVSDTNNDGVADTVEPWLTDLFSPLGLAWRDDNLYISSQNRIIVARDLNGNGFAEWVNGAGQHEARELYSDLGVAAGQHQNNNLAFGPDGMLYVGVGGLCNVCEQPNRLASSILRLDPEGGRAPEVFATGFRNPFGLAFDQWGQLWSTDNGADPPVVEAAPDELNLVTAGAFYGFPQHVAGPLALGGGVTQSVIDLPPHSSANTIVFYGGDHLPALRGQALIAYFGPDTRRDANSHKVVRVDLSDPAAPRVDDFATGFDRPLAMTAGPDGRLYIADFSGGKLYRISRP